jgi:hypothetical protein
MIQEGSDLIQVSNSEISTWQRCRRKWFVLYYLCFAPAGESPVSNMALGSRVHLGLEGFYGYGLDPVTVLRVVYAAERQAHPDYDAELAAEEDLALAMVSGYPDWLSETGSDAGLEVIGTETEVTVGLPTLPGVVLRCRLDQLARRAADGSVLFMDYKTAANFERHEMLRMDPQMKTYQVAQHLDAARRTAAGEADVPVVSGGLITTLRRVKRSAKAVPPFYDRTPVFMFNPDEARSTYLRIVGVAREIVAARRALDAIYEEQGGALAAINDQQREFLYPTQIIDRCKWDCPLAGGTCPAMDDGSDWPGILTSSGRFMQVDPYSHYRDQTVQTIKDQLEKIR